MDNAELCPAIISKAYIFKKDYFEYDYETWGM